MPAQFFQPLLGLGGLEIITFPQGNKEDPAGGLCFDLWWGVVLRLFHLDFLPTRPRLSGRV
jgi:hypothetical protein